MLPGMYAYATVLIDRPGVWAVPASALTQIGNDTCCYLVVDGKAVRTPVQTGVSDGAWTEVTAKQVRSTGAPEGSWEPLDGTEAVIDGDLSALSDGEPVKVDPGNK
jgi:hypothetical protein